MRLEIECSNSHIKVRKTFRHHKPRSRPFGDKH